MSTRQKKAVFQVGDRVLFDFGTRKITGFIVEDQGPLGVGGRRLYHVEVPIEPDEPMLLMMPEDEIEGLAEDISAAPPLEKKMVMAYLTYGGLISILRANVSGGPNQPRAWLCPDTLGNVTHTFRPNRGIVGGQIVPFWAIRDDKVFAPKRDAVVSFVESFGLTRKEAEAVVAKVGTAA